MDFLQEVLLDEAASDVLAKKKKRSLNGKLSCCQQPLVEQLLHDVAVVFLHLKA